MGALRYPVSGSPEMLAIYDTDGAQQSGGFRGIWDAGVRAYHRWLLGENAIRVLGLDRAVLAAGAGRVGPTVDALLGGPNVDPKLIDHFDRRGGYLKPAEGDARIPLIADIVRDDLVQAGVPA